jgi:hypothetical protein
MQFDELNVSFEVLNQGSAAFHPITAVEVCDVSRLLDFGAMDVAANHALNVVLVSHVQHGFLVFRDIFDCGFGLVFQIAGQ